VINVDIDLIYKSLQDICDAEGEGWTVVHYAVAAGLERVTDDGHIESASFVHQPVDQSEYTTRGLLAVAQSQEWTHDDE
jgi:hypothetical protein